MRCAASSRSRSSPQLLLLACAWGYVALRAFHTYIHLTHNKVMRRFQAFVASAIVLYVMWGIFVVRLIDGRVTV